MFVGREEELGALERLSEEGLSDGCPLRAPTGW